MASAAAPSPSGEAMSLNQQREMIQRKLHQLRQERENASAEVERMVSERGDQPGTAPAPSHVGGGKGTINGVPVAIGDRITVTDDSKLLEQADSVLGALRDRTKVIYLGETGKVVAILQNYFGRDGVELRFADDVKKFFFADCLRLDTLSRKVTPCSTPPAAATPEPEVQTHHAQRDREALTAQETSVMNLSTAAAKTAPTRTATKVAARQSNEPPTNQFEAAPSRDQEEPVGKCDPPPMAPASRMTPVEDSRPSPELPSTANGSMVQSSRAPEPRSTSFYGLSRAASILDPQTWLMTKKELPLSIPSCPPTYVPRHELPSAGSRIPRIAFFASGALSAAEDGKITPQPKRLESTSSLASTPSKLKTIRSPSPLKSPTPKPNIAANTAAKGGLARDRPSMGSGVLRLVRCKLVTKDELGPPVGGGKNIVIRESHTSMASVMAFCTRELGWTAKGCRVERLFDGTSGREIAQLTDLSDGMTLVATSGDDFSFSQGGSALGSVLDAVSRALVKVSSKGVISPSRRRPLAQSSAEKTGFRTVSPTMRRGGSSDAVKGTVGSFRASTPTLRTQNPVTLPPRAASPSLPNGSSSGRASPSRSVPLLKPIVVKVFCNGEYGDMRSDPFPFRTVVVRPTHKTMLAVNSLLARELGWNAIRRKVEVLYTGDGAEIRDVSQLVDGASVVAASGERFIPPHPNSVLFEANRSPATAAFAPADEAQVRPKPSVRTATTPMRGATPKGSPLSPSLASPAQTPPSKLKLRPKVVSAQPASNASTPMSASCSGLTGSGSASASGSASRIEALRQEILLLERRARQEAES